MDKQNSTTQWNFIYLKKGGNCDTCYCAQSVLSVRLCNPTDYSPPGSSVLGILQPRMLEWVAMPSSRASSQSREQTYVSSVSCTGRQSFHHWHHLENLTHATTWVNSEDMMLSEISQSPKDK